MKSGLDGANARIDALAKTVAAHETSIANANAKAAEQQNAISTHTGEISDLKRQIAALTAAQEQAASNSGRGGMSAADANRLRDELDALRSRFDRLNEELNDLRSAVNANTSALHKRGSGAGAGAGVDASNLVRRDEYDRYTKVTDQRLSSLERDRDTTNANIRVLLDQAKKNNSM